MLQPPALGASCSAIGAWLRLLVFASDRDSERVPAFANERESMTAAGVTLAEIEEAVVAGLVKSDGESLLIGGFDHAGLAACRARAAGGKEGGRHGAVGPTGKRGGRPKKTPLEPLKGFPGNPSRTPQETPHEPPSPLLSFPSLSDPEDPDSSEPRGARSEPAVVETFKTAGVTQHEVGITQDDVAAWEAAFPAVDVIGEMRRARAWLAANPRRAKTARGLRPFLVAWLARQQDRGPSISVPTGRANSAADVRVGHARAETAVHTNGEVKL